MTRLIAALPDPPEPVWAARCAEVTDWERLLVAGVAHGLAGVLALACVERGGAPERARVELQRQLAALRVRQRWSAAALDEVLAVCAAAGVRCAPLKGPFLAQRLYGAAPRPSGDLDLLVAPEDLARAADALSAVGFEPTGDAASEAYHREHHHHVSRCRPGAPLLELHFRAFTGFGATLAAHELLGRATRPPDRWALCLAPEDEALYLLVHAAGHQLARLGWLYDVKLLARARPDLDWGLVAERARRQRLELPLAYALEAARRFVALDAPAPLALGLRAPGPLRREAAARLRALAEGAPPAGSRATFAQLAFQTALADGGRQAARFLLHHLSRVAKRRARARFPGVIPERWGG